MGSNNLQTILKKICDAIICPGKTYMYEDPPEIKGYVHKYQDNTGCSGCANHINIYQNIITKKYLIKKNINIYDHVPTTINDVCIITVVDFLLNEYCDPNTTADVFLKINFDGISKSIKMKKRHCTMNPNIRSIYKNLPVFKTCDDSHIQLIKILEDTLHKLNT